MTLADWPPEWIFALSCLIGAIGGVGRLMGDTTKPFNVRTATHAFIIHGLAGGGISGVGYEYLGWKGRPLAMLGFAALYGAGVISATFILNAISGMLPSGSVGGANAKGD